ncbi:hypothetical protein KUTeg_002795 [Tegillarca granosa]|uniref:C3H1-type domain-containing protein n=1 Tax=Tegillarca granosa TaxID=220873 RepID=A0ABQ9FSI9_TEGGR|nr:hypothetical protein KUTeg_002795 [Tegillarca granosa]
MELFIDYRLQLKDFESAHNEKLKQRKENAQDQGQQPSGNDRSSERQDRTQKKQTTKYGESKSRMASGSYEINVPFVCTFYNQKRCSKTNCTFLHICEGFLDSTCTGCTLSHNIKADQPLSVLSDYGFITSQNAETILERYKFRLQQAGKNHRGKTASRDKKETTREQETEESDEVLQRGRKGQNGNKSSHAGSIIQSEDVDICRNNIRERCKYGENCNRHHCIIYHITGNIKYRLSHGRVFHLL